jgi:hypothetical protein
MDIADAKVFRFCDKKGQHIIMMRNTTILGAIALIGLFAGPTFADTVTIVKDNSDLEHIADYGNIVTGGADMVGLTATVTYVGGSTVVYTYAKTGAQSGAATGGNFSLGVTGPDTYFSTTPWTLSNTGSPAIVDVKLDSFAGDTVFDSLDPDPGTFNSKGTNFAVLSDSGTHAIVATYSGEVSLAGAAPLGDVYRYLDVNFGTTNPFTGTLSFTQDTDNVPTPPLTGVPEPAPMMIMGLGVLMMGGLIARKRIGLKA